MSRTGFTSEPQRLKAAIYGELKSARVELVPFPVNFVVRAFRFGKRKLDMRCAMKMRGSNREGHDLTRAARGPVLESGLQPLGCAFGQESGPQRLKPPTYGELKSARVELVPFPVRLVARAFHSSLVAGAFRFGKQGR